MRALPGTDHVGEEIAAYFLIALGFTWAFDCHLFYRRSNGLALALGSLSTWESELIERMSAGNAETAA